ncbi:hypothetical protein HID58_048543 [Brassica napus]|uniref:Uncharacterized protein n=1 Tax=Brassica napus TaxID=3708 RepID=A0ABQ8B3Z0_BRANA|nr:hypothetical protein HID58_048543 [Brassica napus]
MRIRPVPLKSLDNVHMEEKDSWQEDQSILDEESSYGDNQRSEYCSNTDFEEDPYEEDPEPVPPNPYHVDNRSTDCSKREADHKKAMKVVHGGKRLELKAA